MENTNYLLRHMMEEDISKVYEVERKSFPFPFGEVLIGNIFYAAPELCFIIESEGNIIGFLIGGYTAIPKRAHILSIAVLEDFRGQGLGRRILTYFLNSIGKLGYLSVKLEVNIDNHKAIKLYEEFNFKIDSKIRKYYQDGTDAYLMIRVENEK
ncbi:MAG: ribosomal protein S18-alanine N-acetyltransferase [Candidatus Heimdallarchaeota archaeon]|nr:ribosomal protein S18-alanine N-acetyltransferase [Candidatus Heimdallarchaeota archaeon]MCK4770477.1 ribosomal protein S18-alanine N-acetyltransferase [Candidatus Heimdallarchaeota archaeon]